MGPELRRDILAFYAGAYADPEADVETRRKDPGRWRRNRRDLERLRALAHSTQTRTSFCSSSTSTRS